MDAGIIKPSVINAQILAPAAQREAEAANTASACITDSFTGSGSSAKPESIEEAKKKLFEKKDTKEKDTDYKPIWEIDIPGMPNGAPAAGKDGKIFIGTRAGEINAFDQISGAKLWSSYAGLFSNVNSSSIGPDGTVYTTGGEKNLFAIDSKTGQKKWKFSLTGKANCPPAVSPAGTVVIGDDQGRVYALDSKGQKLWENKVEGKISYQPLTPGDGKIYMASSGVLHALDEKTGRGLWKLSPPNNAYLAGDTLIMSPSGTIYAGSLKNDAYAINSKDGSIKWDRKLEKDAFISGPALDPKGETIFINSRDGKVYALDTKDGSEKWRFADSSYDSLKTITAPVAMPDGNLYFGIGCDKIYVLDASNGQVKREHETETSPDCSAAGSNNIYFTTFDKLIAFNAFPKEPYENDRNEQSGTNKQSPNPGIGKENGYVVIDGVKIPVRKNKPQPE